jgi:hypothetical protein
MRAYLPSGKVPSTDEVNLHRWRGWHADGGDRAGGFRHRPCDARRDRGARAGVPVSA